VLQKISDPVLTVCPACGVDQFQKQVTAAGFQLKGSGWYVTDFRNGGGAGASAPAPAPAPAADAASSSAPAPAPAAAPAASCGGGCACH
jgi:predicted nucleic acid-binding Zn ribbon protein